MHGVDLFFGLYILANIDDKTYKTYPKKAEDLVQLSFCFQKLVPLERDVFIQEKKILQFNN